MSKSSDNTNLFEDNNNTDPLEFSSSESFEDNTTSSSTAASPAVASPSSNLTKILVLGTVFVGIFGYVMYKQYLKPRLGKMPEVSNLLPTTEAPQKQTLALALPKAPTPDNSQSAGSAASTTASKTPANPSETTPMLSKQAFIEQQFAATKAASMEAGASNPKPNLSKNQVPTPTASAPSTPSQTVSEAPVTSSAAPAAAPIAESPQPNSPKDLQLGDTLKQLQALNEQLSSNIAQIQRLEEALQGITQTVSKLNDDVHFMDNRVLALSGSTNSLSAELGSLKRDMGQVKRSLGEEGLDYAVPPPPSHQYPRNAAYGAHATTPGPSPYTVHAIIPGRAWLKGPNGQIVTLTEGDTLGDYGKVLVIDAASGMVLTQSGITLR